MYNGQPLDLPVKTAHGVYTVQMAGTAGLYYVLMYCVGIGANSSSRKTGFFFEATASTGTTYTYTNVNTSVNHLSNPAFYGGDFNLYSGHGMVYSGDVDITLRAPAATYSAAIYKGHLNVAQLTDGVTLA